MSKSIITRIDEMGNRIDDLEKSIGELMAEVRAWAAALCEVQLKATAGATQARPGGEGQ